MIDPRTIQWVPAAGNRDIDHLIAPPFSGRWTLAHVRCHFRDIRSAASGVGVAMFTLSLDSLDGDDWDTKMWAESSVGLSADLFWYPKTDSDIAGYTFEATDRLKFAWTNPDPAEIGWGLKVGFAMSGQ